MQLEKLHSSIDLIQPAAVLAAMKKHTEILQYSLEHGAVFNDDMDSAIQSSGYVPNGMVLHTYQWCIPLLELLWRNDWKQIRTSPMALRDLAEPRFSVEVLGWFLDHGAKLGRSFVKNIRNVSAVKVKYLVDQLGIDAFRNSGVLNEAAIKGQTDVVKTLLDAGICIVDYPPTIDIREGGPYEALLEAVRNKHLDTARLLLDRGSAISEATFEAAKRQGGDMMGLIDHYTGAEGVSHRQVHVRTPEVCDPRGTRKRGLGQGYAKSPSFGYLFAN